MFDYKFNTEHGKSYGLFALGEVIFVTLVIVINLKLLAFSSSFSLWIVFLMIGSAGLSIVIWGLANDFDLSNLEHTFGRTFLSEQYLVFLIFCLGITALDAGLHKIYCKKSLTQSGLTTNATYRQPQKETTSRS